MEFLVEFTVNIPAGTPETERESDLRGRLEALPLYAWMTLGITPLAAHLNDPALAGQI